MSGPERCVSAGCAGSYDEDGYCDECGHKQAGGAAPPAPVTEGSTPSAPGRTSSATTGRGRGAAALAALPVVPRRDPAGAILPDPQVPEHRRFCGTCEHPVGRARDGRPGLVEGFCTNCRTQYSFRPSLPPGAEVAGRYEVLGAIAYGGLGWIYLARDRNVGDEVSDRWVVLKGLIDSGDADATAAAITERRFLVEVDHPSIVKIYDFVSHPDPRSGDRVGYIVMEYVGGLSLRDIYLARPVTGGVRQPLPLTQVIAYALEVLPALGYLHERELLYCDFKPDNALHTDQRVKLVDLGAVRRVDDDASAVWGTVGYQAPEVATAGPSVASDLYTVARSMAVLSFDFRGFTTTFADHLPDPSTVPLLAREESYHRLLLRATDPDPGRRFVSAAEMAEQLTGVLRQVLSAGDGQPRPSVSSQFTGERRAFGTMAGVITAAAVQAAGARPAGAEVVAALPVPTVDPADPGAALLATMQAADPVMLSAALSSVGADGVEVALAVIRARIAAGDLDGAGTDLAAVTDPDWRVDWYRGMVALAADRPEDARSAFDAVYGALPGELAPQLALAAAAEAAGDTESALRHYAAVWRTDRAFVSAAFGVARILAERDDLPGAVAILDAVPDSSSHSVPAQVAAVRARLAAPVSVLAEPDLVDVSGRVERLGLDVERRARLTVETLRTALAWVQAGRAGPQTGTATVLTHRLSERDLRLGLERAFRILAKVAPDRETRIDLVDQANRIPPEDLAVTPACPICAAPTVTGDHYCESCGADLSTPGADTGQFDLAPVERRPGQVRTVPVTTGSHAGPAVWLSSRAADVPCAQCGAAVGDDGYCDGCGRRRGAGSDHAEHDLPGVAAVTDRGLRKGRNEDAYAIGVAGGRRAVVVCDGVSSAPDSDAAATTAVVEAIGVLVGGGDIAGAYASASAAVAELAGGGRPLDAPACTFLAAVVEGGQLTVGWVGDSRAYWLDGDGARCLTVDDSLAGQLAAAGIDADALRLSAQAAALTRWLGADAPGGDPHLTTLRPATAGVLLLSSDGLTRYPTWTDAIQGNDGAAALARRLTTFARDAGGADNITVAAVPFDPEPSRGAPQP